MPVGKHHLGCPRVGQQPIWIKAERARTKRSQPVPSSVGHLTNPHIPLTVELALRFVVDKQHHTIRIG